MYGGLGRHVHALTRAQAAAGDEVVVLTQAARGAPRDRMVRGVRVLRVPNDAPRVGAWHEDLLGWMFGFNVALARSAMDLPDGWRPQVVHGHDWLVAQAGVLSQQSLGVPLIATVHATESGRQGGLLSTALSRAVDSTEQWMADHADRLIVCSEAMRAEVGRLFGRRSGVTVVPNGIEPGDWRASGPRIAAMREAYGDPLIVFTGRLEHEKGVHTLIRALPRVRRAIPGARLVITGRGTAEVGLRALVRRLRVEDVVTFAGWVSEPDLRALVAAADAAVVPSLYEPFGLVALEAAVLGAPLVVSDVGGLAEIVDDGRTGRTFPAGDSRALASVLVDVLSDRDGARLRASTAADELPRSYGWSSIAERTRVVYRDAGPR